MTILVTGSTGTIGSQVKRRDRRVGLAEDLPEGWVEAVRNAKVPDEFAALDAELKQQRACLSPTPFRVLLSVTAICGTASIWPGGKRAKKTAPARS